MPGQGLSAGTPKVLFKFAANQHWIRGYDITPDGKRFLIQAHTQITPTEVT